MSQGASKQSRAKESRNSNKMLYLPVDVLLLVEPNPPKPVDWVLLLLEPKPPKPPPKDILNLSDGLRVYWFLVG